MIRTRVVGGLGQPVSSGMPVGETSPHSYFLASRRGPDDLSDNGPTGACGYGRVLLPGHPMRERPQVFFGRHRLAGYGADPLVSTEEVARQEAALAQLTTLTNGLRTTAVENIERWGPAVGQLAQSAVLAASGEVEAASDAAVEAAATAASLAGPIGVILGTVLRIWNKFAQWLAHTYPAEQICCAKEVDNRLPAYLGFGPGEDGLFAAYNSAGLFYVCTFLYKVGPGYDWAQYSDCAPSVMSANFGSGTAEQRLAQLVKLCSPYYEYQGDVPIGFKSWRQWEADAGVASNAKVQAVKDAQAAVGQAVVDRLFSQGAAQYFGFKMTDHCWVSGYSFGVQGLPDTTLLDLIRGLCGYAVDEATKKEAEEVALLDPIAIPGVPEGASRVWHDGLSRAILTALESSDQKTYHLAALLKEYNARVEAGVLPRVASAAAKKFVAKLPRKSLTLRPLVSASKGESITIGGKTAPANIVSESPLAFQAAANFPIGTSLAAVIRGKSYRCDCTQEGADVRCRCK